MDLQALAAMTEPVAERHFELQTPNGTTSILVRVGRPVAAPELNGDWRCPVEIAGLAQPVAQWAAGVDALQALLLGVQLVHVYLRHLSQQPGHTLTWLGAVELGVPDILGAS